MKKNESLDGFLQQVRDQYFPIDCRAGLRDYRSESRDREAQQIKKIKQTIQVRQLELSISEKLCSLYILLSSQSVGSSSSNSVRVFGTMNNDIQQDVTRGIAFVKKSLDPKSMLDQFSDELSQVSLSECSDAKKIKQLHHLNNQIKNFRVFREVS